MTFLKTADDLAKYAGVTSPEATYPAAFGVLRAKVEMFLMFVENKTDVEAIKRQIQESFGDIVQTF